tara:strand:+ start:202 stop:399 length:198 start_codon:yes stop_codon:yes gene_type:complete
MKESDCIAVKSVLKKAERETERRDIGIIEIAKESGFIDKSGKVTQEGQRFLQERIVNFSLTVSDK